MDIVREVLKHFPLPGGVTVRSLEAGGFSGADVWQIGGDWCLKASPLSSRLAWIHGLVETATQSGLEFTPQILRTNSRRTFVEHSGRSWELMTWLPGCADFRDQPTPARIVSACAALARLHRCWAEAGQGTCPALRRRLQTAEKWSRLCQAGWQPRPEPGDPLLPVIERIWALLQIFVPLVPGRVMPLLKDLVPLQPCLCDIWHDNVLFQRDNVTGLLDFASVKVDNVAVDLARLLGSLLPLRKDRWQIGLEAYARIRPLTRTEEKLIPVLEETAAVLGPANWLMWLYHEGRTFQNRQRVLNRLEELERRLRMVGG